MVVVVIGVVVAVAVYAALAGTAGVGLTFIKDKHSYRHILPGHVIKVTRVIETNKVARIFAGIFTFGLSELMNHRDVSVEYLYEDEFIGSNEKDAVEELYKRGNEFYKKGDYETAATLFASTCNLAEASGNINEKYKESLQRVRQKIKEEAERREQEAERIKREAERQAREEALQLEKARTQSKSLLEEAINIYQQAEALYSLELKLEKYEAALSKCEESCASGAMEEAFNTLNKIFESCLKHDAYDEAENAIQIVRKYFPSAAGRFQDALANQQNTFWSPDYENRAHREQKQQEQNRTVMILSSS